MRFWVGFFFFFFNSAGLWPHLVYLLSSISVAILLTEKQRHFLLRNLIAAYRLFCRFSILLNLDQKKIKCGATAKTPESPPLTTTASRRLPLGTADELRLLSPPQWSPVTDVAPSFQLFCRSISTCFQSCACQTGRDTRGRPSYPGVGAELIIFASKTSISGTNAAAVSLIDCVCIKRCIYSVVIMKIKWI